MALKLNLIIPNSTNSDGGFMTIGVKTPRTIEISAPDKNIYSVSLYNISFKKQMYQPGRIDARVQIVRKDGTIPDHTDMAYYMLTYEYLKKFFTHLQVTLSDADNSNNKIAEKYVIYDVIPQYADKSLYVDLVIYSPDYALTTDIKSQTFVAKRLGEEIMKKEFSNSTTELQNKLLYKKSETEKEEFIHPYLVQYNESFYDLLTRTANRWGEFVYYEDGILILGRKLFYKPEIGSDGKPTGKFLADNQTISSYESLSYLNESTDPTLLANSKKSVTTDRYLERINKGEYIEHAGDMRAEGDSQFFHKMFQSIFCMKGNVFDWITNFFIDEGIATAQNKNYLDDRREEYDNKFFNNPFSGKEGDALTRLSKHYNSDSSPTECCQFAYYDCYGGLTEEAYKQVLKWEQAAEENVLCLALGATYQHLRLGDIFQFKNGVGTDGKVTVGDDHFLVIGVECVGKIEYELVYNEKTMKDEDKATWKAEYFVRAVKYVTTDSSNKVFYPPMLPTGHIRFSGPQRAVISDTLDPMLNGRYRVRNTWQSSSEPGSPWLKVAREMMGEESGSVWELKKDANVLIDFEDGNVELPYIVGVLQKDDKRANSRASMFNVMDMTTPCGHAIRLHDGAGGGSSNFMASFIPLVSWIKGFYPHISKVKHTEGNERYYDGGMELTDKYGIYSIKASTDKRNITISSPYGDVKLNAFSGITISAPNGDVKIQGKNVSIEAGNNVSIVSGKNITNGFLGAAVWGNGRYNDWSAGDVGISALNAAAKKVAEWFDLSYIRDVFEIFLRPIRGTMSFKSSRNMVLQAGLNKNSVDDIPHVDRKDDNYLKWVQKNWGVINFANTIMDRRNGCDDTDIWSAPQYGTILFKCITNKAQYFNWNDVYGHGAAQAIDPTTEGATADGAINGYKQAYYNIPAAEIDFRADGDVIANAVAGGRFNATENLSRRLERAINLQADDSSDVSRLNTRVGNLEASVGRRPDGHSNISDNADNITTNTNDIRALQTAVDRLNREVGVNDDGHLNNIQTNTVSIQANTADIDLLNMGFDALQQRTRAIQQRTRAILAAQEEEEGEPQQPQNNAGQNNN